MKYRELKGYKYDTQKREQVDTGITIGKSISCKYHYLSYGGRLSIRRGYAWDGASFLTFDTKSSMRGSLIHDALYQLMREGHLDRDKWRERADELLRDICIEDGMWEWRANMWYFFVRHFGKKSSMPRKKPRGKIIEI